MVTGKDPSVDQLIEVLGNQRSELVVQGSEHYLRSSIRMPGAVDQRMIKNLILHIVESFVLVLPRCSTTDGTESLDALFQPGSVGMRELERSVSFVGSVMEAQGNSAFDVAGVINAFRDSLTKMLGVDRLLPGAFEWLAYLALDSFSTAARMSERERQREQLSRGTPILLITPELPAVLLVGQPDGSVLDNVFARFLLAIVRSGAQVAILDASGLSDKSSEIVIEKVAELFQHRAFASVDILVVGVNELEERAWGVVQPSVSLEFHGVFDRAVARALEKMGMRLL